MKTLYWLRNDLRLHDNRALYQASKGATTLDLLYSFDKSLSTSGPHRKSFWLQTLKSFHESLSPYQQSLSVVQAPLESALENSPTYERVVATRSYNSKGIALERQLAKACEKVGAELQLVDQAPLILREQLPFELSKLKSFTPFRKKIEAKVEPNSPIPPPRDLPPPQQTNSSPLSMTNTSDLHDFTAGEAAALNRLDHYLWQSQKALTYKKTRNGMVQFDDSTKLSPYLALGSLSPRTIFAELKSFESQIEANESTYWIYFELLWRDFFKFYSLKHGEKLFRLSGPRSVELEWLAAPERNQHWRQWTRGKTGQDFVDANMRELLTSGWMSNRGRQNVASYWAKHMFCDWRLGARWFEKQLIDYDVESNWGNWAYNSGVGPDPRDRKFDLEKQAQMYDANFEYRNKFLK